MKKREIFKAVLFVGGILFLAAACNTKDNSTSLDFNITVPSDWKFFIENSNGVVYYAQSPLKTSADTIAEDLLITKDAASGYSVSSFYTAYLTTLTKDTSFRVVSVIDTTINGVAAKKLLHLQTIPVVNSTTGSTVILHAKILKYFMMHNNFGYIVSFNALQTTYNDFKSVFDGIIASFTFRN
jgi:hypothetical protein